MGPIGALLSELDAYVARGEWGRAKSRRNPRAYAAPFATEIPRFGRNVGMRSFPLLAFWIPLLAGFAPARANAVLFPDEASRFDTAPAYKGCPKIGDGDSRPESEFCKGLKKPEDYCKVFQVTSSLRNDGDATGTYQGCVGFYTRALEGQHLFCDFQRDAQALGDRISADTNGINGARDAFGIAALSSRCSQKIYGYYRQAAIRQATVLDKAWSGSKKLLLRLTDAGAAHLKAEAHCQKDGIPGAAPGYLLVGASTYAMSDQKQTYDNVYRSLVRFEIAMMQEFNAATAKTDQISRNGTNLGEVAKVDGVTAPRNNESDITGANDKKDRPNSNPVATGAKDASQDLAKAAAKRTLLTDLEKAGERTFFQDLFLPAAEHSVRGVVAENAGGAVVALGVTYLKDGKVTAGDVAGQVFVAGIGVMAGLFGAPAMTGIALTGGASVIVEKIKSDFEAYDKEVQEPYIGFARGMVKQADNVTSQEIAKAYKAQKAQLAYCSKCNDRDMSVGCPGMQGAAHGFNSDYYAPNQSNVLYYNPWVKAAYEQYRSRHPNGEAPFLGAATISPVTPMPGVQGP